MLLSILLSLPAVQTHLGKWATRSLNKKYNTNINIGRVNISALSGNVWLNGVYIEDHKKDTLIYVNELKTSILSVNKALKGKLTLGDVEMEAVTLNIKTYLGEEDSNLDIFVEKLDDGSPPSDDPFLLSSSHLTVDGGNFRISDENKETQRILHFTELYGDIEDFKILGPDVEGNVRSISFLDSRGIRVVKLQSLFKYSRSEMRFDALHIKTSNSHLNGALVFTYDREDLQDFENKVHINGTFENSEVMLDEVNVFYNEFGKGKNVKLSSKVAGTLNDIVFKELSLSSENTRIKGDFSFENLLDDQAPFKMDATIENLSSNYYQLKNLLPDLLGKTLPASFSKFGQFTIRGRSVVTEDAIDAKLNLFTDIGNSYSDLKLSDINNIDNASYTGFISLENFNIGQYIEDEKLGRATLDFDVKGKGFTQEMLDTEVSGKIFSITWNGYDYKDVAVSGVLKDQLFDGNLKADDPNFRVNFKGLADLSGELNSFDFTAEVDHADLKKMNLMNKDSVSVFKGDVQMNILGNSIENIAGEVSFKKTSYTNQNDTYYFDDFNVVSSFEEDGSRLLVINSPDIINGTIKGKFTYKEMPKLIENSVGSIYTNYSPHDIAPGQNIDFNLKIYNKIVEVFYPEIEFGKNTFIKGSIVGDDGDFKLTFKSPQIKAYGNNMDNVNLKVDNKNPIFNTYIEVNAIKTEYYDVSGFSLINTTIKDTLFFRTEFKGGKRNGDIYNLNFYHTFNSDKQSVIGLKKSDVSFKGYKWFLNEKNNSRNRVVFNRTMDSVRIEDLVMTHENEKIDLSGTLIGSEQKDIRLQFENVSLNKVTPDIESLKLRGIINGEFNFLQQQNNYLPSSNLTMHQLEVNGYDLGDLKLDVVGNENLTNYAVNARLINNENVESLGITGNISYINGNSGMDVTASFKQFNLAPFSNLGDDVITNIRGYASGDVKLTGKLNNPNMSGLLELDDAGLKIAELNTDYNFIAPARVSMYEQSFEFDNIILSDVVYSSTANLNGTITHQQFKDWYLDLIIDTREQRFLVLNTPPSEEALYYGTGFISGFAEIYGPTDAVSIKVQGATEEGTSLKIPVSDVAAIGDYSFINFINKNEEETVEEGRVLRDYPGLELEFDLDVQPNAEVEIVVDQKTGSSLKGTGAGNLLIEINTKGKFNMYGDFITFTGDYNFKYGGLIDKHFKVQPGGTINWDGDPLGARINMEAVYSLTANPAVLIENQNFTKRIPTNVVIALEGELMQPEPDFRIEFPAANAILNSELQYRLDDPDKRELQALSLLSQGTFINEVSITQQALTGNLIETANSLVNQILSNDDNRFDVGLSYEQGYRDPNADFQTEDRLGVTVSTQISDRILINGKIGVPVGGVSETVVAGDVEVQVLLNEDGSLSAKIFNRENEINEFLADRQGYTQGVGLSYQVDFNTFKELLQKIFVSKKKREQRLKEAQENDTVPKEKDVINTMGDGLIKVKPKKTDSGN